MENVSAIHQINADDVSQKLHIFDNF